MPTQVNPDDPNATGAARLQAMVGGARDPGTPSMAGKPGVQAGRFAFPNPPAPASAPPGRPANGARAAMAGTQPSQPGTPAPGAAPTLAAPPSAAAPPPTPGSSQPAPGAGSQTTKGVGAPVPPPPPALDALGGAATQTFTSATIPPAGSVLPGSQVQTPLGTVSAGADGSQRLALDANGQQRYKEAMAALRGRFAVPKVMKGMADLPEMELKLGASNFDPFSGRFHGKD
jgi:hypothetical protein